MISLSTHVLDTTHGCPAAGVRLRLLTGEGALIREAMTDHDGRCAVLPAVVPGTYRIEFHMADYFRSQGVALLDPPFLDVIPIDFGVSEPAEHYHVPLLVSPFGYSTYRGS